MSDSRKEFEAWYVTAAFDYERNPIGSRECGLQWAAWQAARRAALEEAAKLAAENKLLSHPFGPQFAMGWADAIESCAAAISALAAQTGQEGE